MFIQYLRPDYHGGHATGGHGGGAFFPKVFSCICPPPPPFPPKIISNVFKLIQIWPFQHTNGNFLHFTCFFFLHFWNPNKFSRPPLPAQKKIDAGDTTDLATQTMAYTHNTTVKKIKNLKKNKIKKGNWVRTHFSASRAEVSISF